MHRWLPGVDPRADSPLPRPDGGALDGLRTDLAEAPAAFDLPLPWALPACAALLRRAGEELARLPVEARIAGLDRVARSWLDPGDALRQEALAVLPAEVGLSAPMVAWGLDRAFEAANAESLAAWWSAEGGRTEAAPGLSGHVHSGNVFAAGLPPVFASLLAGVPALIKAPSAAPSFPVLLARSFALHAPELGPCVAAAAWSRQDSRSTDAFLGAVDALFAFGDDGTVEALRQAATCPVHGFGHRFSVGFVAAGTDPLADPLADSLAALALDALAWDGAGCLTPLWVFVEGDPARARSLAEEFAPAFERAGQELPAGPLGEAAGAARAMWLGVEAVTGWARSGPGWAVSARNAATLDPAPPGRCLPFLPVADRALLPALLSPLGPRLQGLALVGTPADGQELRSLLGPLGLSLVAPAGRLHAPELAWNHDDVALLPALC